MKATPRPRHPAVRIDRSCAVTLSRRGEASPPPALPSAAARRRFARRRAAGHRAHAHASGARAAFRAARTDQHGDAGAAPAGRRAARLGPAATGAARLAADGAHRRPRGLRRRLSRRDTWAATRVGSPWPTRPEKTTKAQAPSATRALVRRPAIFWCHCRSKPIAEPSSSATVSRSADSPKEARSKTMGLRWPCCGLMTASARTALRPSSAPWLRRRRS